MDTSSFDIIGPAMIGPSSSHTAGAVRIGLLAHYLVKSLKKIKFILIELHGSFAASGKGHATDRGLVAGLLGFMPDDERLKDSLEISKKQGLNIEFKTIDLGADAHPNSVKFTFIFDDETRHTIIGASVGGGNVEIREIDGFQTNLTGALDSVVFWHMDKAGFLARVTGLLACVEMNIASISTSRRMRDSEALTIVTMDSTLPDDCISVLQRIPFVKDVVRIPKII